MGRIATRGPGIRDQPAFRCVRCDAGAPRWVGRCPECSAWGTVEEVGPRALRSVARGPVRGPARPIREVDAATARARPTGLAEFDRVLGGGLVPGAVVLLAGEPGTGKSTLLLAVAARCATAADPCLVVTGEESAAQVRLRADRVGALHPQLYLAAETDLSALLAHVDAVRPRLLVVDSIQTVASAQVEGSPGGVTQVREVAAALIAVAKERGIATILVGHVTKDGAIAGPRVLEHLVDVVLHFDGDRHGRLRVVRAGKNRFGSADEVGCFELRDDGIAEVADPSGLFLSRHTQPVAGSCVTVTLDGTRPLVTEVQALVSGATAAVPRRASSGVDAARTVMLLAVLERRAGAPLAHKDVFVATVGGGRIAEPAGDLAAALAVASAATDRPLPPGLVAVGEVGLAGELRPVPALGRRLAEAARLGFTTALVPPEPGPVPDGMTVLPVTYLREALAIITEHGPARTAGGG